MSKRGLRAGISIAVLSALTALLANALFLKPAPIKVGRSLITPQARTAPFGFHSLAQNAVCLSGGGYRAALFDVGALWRLNELGALQKIDLVSSVSGGSLVGAYLVLHWSDLQFDKRNGVASNFSRVIAEPILRLTKRSIVLKSLAYALVTRHSVAEEMAGTYTADLYGHSTLSDLPSFTSAAAPAPRLLINATRLEDGSLWTFGQDGITAAHWPTDYDNAQTGDDRQLPIAVAVAASAAFPPFLAPLTLDMRTVLPSASALLERYRKRFSADDPDADAYLAAYVPSVIKMAARVSLVDGGVLNNGATEWCSGVRSTVVVSAAVPDSIAPVGNTWVHTLMRVLDDMYAAKEFADWKLAYATVGVVLPSPLYVSLQDAGSLSRYQELLATIKDASSQISLTSEERATVLSQRVPSTDSLEEYAKSSLRATQLALVSTNLRSLSTTDQNNLINLGYLVADFVVLRQIMYPGPPRPMIGSSTPATPRDVFPNALSAPFRLPRPVPNCLVYVKVRCASGADTLLRLE
jgi:predicted acylesterase/phospholipase RssA